MTVFSLFVMFPRTDFMGIDERVKLIYARKPRRIGLFSPGFLTAELRTRRDRFQETNPLAVRFSLGSRMLPMLRNLVLL